MRDKFRNLQQQVGSKIAAIRIIGFTGLLIYLICGQPIGPRHEGSNLHGTTKELLGNVQLKQSPAVALTAFLIWRFGATEAELRLDVESGDEGPPILATKFEETNGNVTPGKPWYDDRGKLIQAHGGGVLYHEGTYYWFGEYKAGPTYIRYSRAYSPPRVDILGVSCYSSADLVHWYYEGLALKGGSHPDIKPSHVLERPTVLHQRQLGKFVMWMHVDTGDYEWAHVGVAVADHITGPYRFLKSFRPHNQESRDCTVFQDDDGSAYLAYASEDNHVMHIAPLTEDYLDVKATYKRILIGLKREAPTLFKFKDYYLLLTSGCTGWEPNAAEIFYSREVMGDWTSLGNPSAGAEVMDRAFSFFSQPASVIPIQGLNPTRFIYMADEWHEMDLASSRYIWLPMWVEEVAAEDLEEEKRRWKHAYDSQTNGAEAAEFAIPPGPLNIIIPWLETWSPSILKSDIDGVTREQYLSEKRDYTLY